MLKSFVQHAASLVLTNGLVRAPLKGLISAGVVPRSAWLRFPVEGQFEFKTFSGVPLIYSPVSGDQLARPLFWVGLDAVAPETTTVFCKLARQANLVLDVGAYTGIFGLLACAVNPQCQVIAVEPVPRIFERMEHHFRLNKFEDRCRLYNMAVSNEEGTFQFHVPSAELPSSGSLTPGGFRGQSGSVIDVEVKTIDALVPEGTRVDLIKIDVEWNEDKALQGASRVLAESRPTMIVECLPDGPYQAVEAIVRDLGYRFYHLRPSGPTLVESLDPDAADEDRNFLFTVHDSWDKLG